MCLFFVFWFACICICLQVNYSNEYLLTSSQWDFSLSLFTFQLHSDLDKGDSMVKYTLSGEGVGSIFTIEPSTGDIHALRSLDREEKPYYTLRAQAVDMLTGRPLEPESEFIIKVQDINDNEPRFLEGPYSASVQRCHPSVSSLLIMSQMFGCLILWENLGLKACCFKVRWEPFILDVTIWTLLLYCPHTYSRSVKYVRH